MENIKELVRKVIIEFCQEFILNPYLCYTEHGQHAYFFHTLISEIPESLQYASFNHNRVCIVQKEYPTASNLGKPKRSHWDIVVLKVPLESTSAGREGIDFLKVDTIVEFGMNAEIDHLEDDVMRISHPDSNSEFGFVVHLHRLSASGNKVSGRDWSPHSKQIVTLDKLPNLTKGKPVEVIYAMSDKTGSFENGVWVISANGETRKIFSH